MSFESQISYNFNDKSLLEIALSHPSRRTHAADYQRFEFLGDSILSATISKYLFKNYPKAEEGKLNAMRSSIVCGESLAKKAKLLKLNEVIILSTSFKKSVGTPSSNMLEDSFEALIAAIYLDSDLLNVEKWLLKIFAEDLIAVEKKIIGLNPKGRLQEWCQIHKPGYMPEYKLISKSGPDHKKQYTVEIFIEDKVLGHGISGSIKNAEINAAINALSKIEIS